VPTDRSSIPAYLRETKRQPYRKGRRVRIRFLDKGLLGLSRVIKSTYVQWDLAGRAGLFQRLDPRLKLLFLAFYAVAISLKKEIAPEIFIMVFLLALTILSRLQLIPLYSRVLVLGIAFGGLLSLPAACNLIVPGTIVVRLATLDSPHDFLFYHIPQVIGLTKEGLYQTALLSLRVTNSVTACLLVLYSTQFPDLIKALGLLRVPDVFIIILTLFHKYLFILACSLEEMHLAMKSRLTSPVRKRIARVWATSRMAYTYRKSQQKCEEVFNAMLSRGFTGGIRLTAPYSFAPRDWLAGSALLAVWIVIVLL
jgi:cobalt/nickel transport system permease protein